MSSKSLLKFAVAALAAVTFVPGAHAQDASVRVIHGIPGQDVGPSVDPALPVDVLVNDAICLLSGFTFGQISGPYTLPAGTYDVKISLANTLEPCSNAAVVAAPVPVEAGENATIIAHLDEAGMPTAAKFVNDVTPTGDGNGRLVAHHAAAAPTVDALVSFGFPRQVATVPGLSNGGQAAAELPAGTITVGIAPAGETRPIFIRTLRLQPGLTTVAYAVGSLANGTFTIIVESIGGLQGRAIVL